MRPLCVAAVAAMALGLAGCMSESGQTTTSAPVTGTEAADTTQGGGMVAGGEETGGPDQ